MDQSKERQCGRKFGYHDKSSAYRVIVQMKRRSGVKSWELQPYKCQFCHRWHVGHRDGALHTYLRFHKYLARCTKTINIYCHLFLQKGGSE